MNGIIDYSRDALVDDSIPFRFEEIANLPAESGEITIPPRTTATVPVTINVPAGDFEGVALGSVHVLLGITQEERDASGMIVNRFAQAIPVRMRVEGGLVEPDFYLGDVGTDLVAYRAAYILNIHHTAPRLTNGAFVSTWIYPAGSNTPEFTQEAMEVDFAPNTIFPQTLLDRAGFGIYPGDYLAKVRIEYGGRVWNFEQAFTVAAQRAEQINTGAVNQQHQARRGLSTTAIAALIASGLLLLAIIAILMLKLKNNSRAKSLEGVDQSEIDRMMAQIQQQRSTDQVNKQNEK